MNTKDFLRLGVPLGEATRRATDFVSKFILGGGDKSRLHEEVAAIVTNPSAFLDDALRKEFAQALLNAPPPPRTEPVKYHQWGDGLDHEAVMQMEKACLLPVSVAGALMPDAHVGYGLPIGGVQFDNSLQQWRIQTNFHYLKLVAIRRFGFCSRRHLVLYRA